MRVSMFIVITTQNRVYLRLNNKMGNFVPGYDSILNGTTVCTCAGIYKLPLCFKFSEAIMRHLQKYSSASLLFVI